MATLTFNKERDTKNKVRFSEVVEDGATAVVGTLYIDQETVASEELGDTLEVTITSA
jgi:hypothetical protein